MTATMAPKKPKKNGPDSKYRPIMLVSIYRYAKSGLTESAIAESLGISESGFKKWKKAHPDINEAIFLGRTETGDGGNWHKFIYERLAPDLREVWDNINSWDQFPNGVVKIEALLSTHGKLVRQQLFLYALVNFNFSKSKAMAKVCIDKDTLDYWIKHDEKFCALVEEIEWHKGNFYEESLVQLIREGDVTATIHANKTFNSDRGYGTKTDVNIRHSGVIDHNVLDLDDLQLSSQCRLEILEALRLRDERLQKEKLKPLMEVEYRVLEDLSDEISREAVEVLNPE